MYTIIVKNKLGGTITEFHCTSGVETVSVGKEIGNAILLNDPSVSGQHCAFEFEGKKAGVKDLKSRNGVLINGQRLKKEKAEISSADAITVGDFSLSLVWTGGDQAEKVDKKKHFLNLVLGVVFFLLSGMIILMLLPQPVQVVEIGEMKPLLTPSLNGEKGAITQESWQLLLSKAKDAYFNDRILESAVLFKQVLALQKDNVEALNFLDQVKKEMIPEIEKSIKTNMEERNILSCDKAVGELTVLDPENPWIKKANDLLEGYKKFQAVQNFFNTNQFKEAQKAIQSVVLVDEETLAEWKGKIDQEVKITESFKNTMEAYRSGSLLKAFKEFKTFIQENTLQKSLQTVARQKLQMMQGYFLFKKLAKQDPLKQTVNGVTLFYSILEKEDPFLYKEVKNRLDELIQQCGPGTDFYVLLQEDTLSQLQQARDYKGIHEVKIALNDYRDALNGLRILAFFSKDPKFADLEKTVYEEIVHFHDQLKTKMEDMKNVNEFEGARMIASLLAEFQISEDKSRLNGEQTSFQGTGDDIDAIREAFNAAVKIVKDTESADKAKETSVQNAAKNEPPLEFKPVVSPKPPELKAPVPEPPKPVENKNVEIKGPAVPQKST
jgi:hypothetical protein